MDEFTFLGISSDNPIHLNIDPAGTDYLCHYTDANGLNGILSGNCFWVTRSDYLNDKSEIIQIKEVIKYVHNMFLENRSSYYNKLDPNGMLLDHFMEYIRFLGNKFDNRHSTRNYDIYVLSLSENSDSLALFSNYSTLNGYCLGFDTDKLLNFVNPTYNYSSHKGLLLTGGRVVYSFKEQIKTLMNDILEVYNTVFERVKYYEIHVIDQALYNRIFSELMEFILFKIQVYAIFFKHPSFYHEEEYRVAFHVGEEHSRLVKYRERGSVSIPYIEYSFDKLPLKFVRKSPKNSSDIKSILDNLGCKDIEILESEIPLR